jgi:2-polyprenyl-6-methoxyphenol hydroxylase-like FAD-dependent oxidoreductase
MLKLRRPLMTLRSLSSTIIPQGTISHERNSTSTPTENVDITIAGGGLVGSAMALALISSPMFKDQKILLLESQSRLPNVSAQQPFSNRVCALNTQSIDLFQSKSTSVPDHHPPHCLELGAWDLMKAIRVQKVSRMQVTIVRSNRHVHCHRCRRCGTAVQTP